MAAIICNVCNLRRAKTGSKGTEISPHTDMCNYCFEEGGYENQHSDHNHDGVAQMVKDGSDLPQWAKDEQDFMETCWMCHPELNLAKKPAQASTGPRKQGIRRAQLNHKGHSHPQTPAARRACKALFWAQSAVKTEQWDAHLDGFGKPVPAPKGGWAGVVPLTKAGNVSMKATKAKVDQVNASK